MNNGKHLQILFVLAGALMFGSSCAAQDLVLHQSPTSVATQAEASLSSPLPVEVAINKEAGRGHLLIVMVRLDRGDELPSVVDTGSSLCILDKSLGARLGECLHPFTVWMRSGPQKSGLYAAPKLYLGPAALKTAPYVATCDFKKISGLRDSGVMGIIGMDCLTNYCVQLDFPSGKMRLLDSAQTNPSSLGKSFSLVSSTNSGPLITSIAAIHQTGLLGGTNTNLLIDTGCNNDGAIDRGVIRGHYLARLMHFLIPFRDLRLGKCVWSGEEYRNLRVGTGWNMLGLRFLARHVVTFDFPQGKMYLKKQTTSPLPRKSKTSEPDHSP